MQSSLETKVGMFVLAALSVFVYMAFQIGAFRFDQGRYSTYHIYFKDVAGLARKADVKIAGVKVGWVETVELTSSEPLQVHAHIMVDRGYALYEDAYSIVRQDGILGTKYIELIPGDPLLSPLPSGSVLGKPTVAPVSFDELLQQFKDIATNVQGVTQSLHDAIGGQAGKEQLRSMVTNLSTTSDKLASFTTVLERSMVENHDKINTVLEIGDHVKQLSAQLENEVLPAVQENIDKIATAVSENINRVASRMESTAIALTDATAQVQEGFKSVSSIACKIDEGQGLIGKLINEEDTYQDIKVAVQGLKNYFATIDMLQVVFDSHFEGMHRPAENYYFEDSKGYIDIRLHPNENYFFLLQLVSSEKGWVDRFQINHYYRDKEGCLIDTDKLHLTDAQRLENVFTHDREIFTRYTVKLGLQIGKIFGDIAFRIGILEGTAGIGLDVDVPLNTEKLRWVSTFEAFDLRGWNRKNDRRPHLKWLNRMFFMHNLYFVFGADDFISKRNANPFFGAGLRFGDDDVKYFLSSLAGYFSGASYNGIAKTTCIN
ncbi:MCE family protein [Vermiphilus pyriformis]|uniref:Mce/MlaD domain-containing protein n=1 Tax=candidate division TM6 bacterium JCVI TM6SC1 TaxID=1306947 RepID=A0A0D2I2M2_9BACT|nr:hypothetical protein J120_00530 [candidate division TM6 bacterium JCVI TM6SC1]UNE35907.1 MAG: MCE family protein [Vermiphilus pyriformis]